MGNEQSVLDENTPTESLASRSVEAVGQYIKDGRARRIVVMTGAGISTSAGIPDFRSPETGLYANLQRLNLPYAEAVFTLDYFRGNPLPFYTLAQELYPGQFRPTITHAFINLLDKKGLLLKLFTQNIDCLEREAGVPDEKIIEAHGSFANQSCIVCKSSYPKELMLKAIDEKSVPYCLQEGCDGLVKPDIVFFGEQLPSEFFSNMDLPREADLCIVMGTSLSVAPFAHLPGLCGDRTPRVLINGEAVGGLGSRPDDVLMIGDCDTGVRKLADACGWLEELEAMWAKTAPEKQPNTAKEKAKKSRDEKLQEEVDKLTKDIEEGLKLEQAQHKWVNEHVDNNFAKIQDAGAELSASQRRQMDKEAVVGDAALGGPRSEAPVEPVKKMDTSHLGFLDQHLDRKSAQFQAERSSENQSLEQHLGSKATELQSVEDIEETLRPMPESEANAEGASASKSDPEKGDQRSHGLSHVFPHFGKL